MAFLKDTGFYVAELAFGSATHTFREIATRLNSRYFAIGDKNFAIYHDAFSHSRVIDYLRSHACTLLAHDERGISYPIIEAMPASCLIEAATDRAGSGKIDIMYEYKSLVLQSTVLGREHKLVSAHADAISECFQKIGETGDRRDSSSSTTSINRLASLEAIG